MTNDELHDHLTRDESRNRERATRTAPPAIDVLLPYYGDLVQLQLAVRSVLSQTMTAFRLVVVDDAYPDPAPARWLASVDDPRLSYLRNDVGLGANGNYRRCLELAHAPLLLVMGADDVMLPGHLAAVIELFAAEPAATIVHTGVRVIDEHGQPCRPLADRVKSFYAPSRRTLLRGEDFAVSVLRGNWTYFPSMAWRTGSIRPIGFRPGLDVVQDLALLLDVAAAGGSLLFDPEVSFEYRRHRHQDSTVRAVDGRRFAEEGAFFRREAADLDQRGWPRAARVARWHISSRLNALSVLPKALRIAGVPAARRVGRHVVA